MSVTNQSCPQIYLLDLRSLAKERVRIRMVAGSNEPTVLDPHVTLTDTRLIEVKTLQVVICTTYIQHSIVIVIVIQHSVVILQPNKAVAN